MMFFVDSAVCVSVLSLHCKVGQVCEEVVCVPLINMAWEQALAIWGQYSMSADEHRRRMLTHTFHSSTVRATTAAHKLLKQQVHTYKQKADLWVYCTGTRGIPHQYYEMCSLFDLLSLFLSPVGPQS